jgi:hypothetical protein
MKPACLPLIALAGFLAAWMPGASAQSAASPAPAAPPEKPRIEARFFNQTTAFAGEITRGIIIAETNQFSFVIPPGFRKKVDANTKTISLTSTSYTCAITATIYESATDGKMDLKPESVRQLLLGRYKSAQVVDEFSASIESMRGPAFELEWPAEAGKMSTRAAFVPYPGGHIEVTVQAPTAEFRAYDQALFQLLMSFRTSPIGAKLAIQEYLTEL